MSVRQSFLSSRQPSSPPAAGVAVLRRSCLNGEHEAAEEECSACAAKRHGMQRRLSIGASNDPLEQEADRVADQILAGASPSDRGSGIQRVQRRTEDSAAAVDFAPESVDDTLSRSGQPLAPALRDEMEQHFGHDFSQVRIHDDATADASARAVGARAYTVGSHIAFAQGRFTPGSAAGRHLLAHELTHVVQQGFATAGTLQRKPAKDEATPAPKSVWKVKEQICERKSHENVDFPNTHITRVNVNLSSQNLSIEWENPSGLSLPSGPFSISAGAGKCCVDCNDETTSRTDGSLCTPKGTFPVRRKGCVLSTADWARNPTFFSRDGIAIHAGPRPGHPASHGCVRTTEEASEIIHDNSVSTAASAADQKAGQPDGRTQIEVSGTWSGTVCYPNPKTAEKRSEACAKPKAEPKQKPKKEGKKKSKSVANVTTPTGDDGDLKVEPVAMLPDGPSEDLLDGPGPA